MHRRKTGALIRASVLLGAVAAQVDDAPALAALHRYGDEMGLAFQIQDDILDVEGQPGATGKTGGRDQALNKATYPSVVGLAEAKDLAATLIADALAAISVFPARADALRWIAESLDGRTA
jgi:farnesyl diphosphate synthase